jgi:hypothetical protein
MCFIGGLQPLLIILSFDDYLHAITQRRQSLRA